MAAPWLERRWGKLQQGRGVGKPPSGPPSGRGGGRGRGGRGGGRGNGNGNGNPWPNPTFSNVVLIEEFEDNTDSTVDVGGFGTDWSPQGTGTPQADATNTLFGQSTVNFQGDVSDGDGYFAGIIGQSTEIPGLAQGGTDIMSVEIWFRPTTLSVNQRIVNMYNANGAKRNWMFSINSSNQVTLGVFPNAASASGGVTFVSTFSPSLNTWHFGGFAHDGDNWYVFCGQEGGLVTIDTFSNTVRPSDTDDNLWVGHEIITDVSQAPRNPFHGQIAQLRVAKDEAFWPTESEVFDVPASAWPQS